MDRWSDAGRLPEANGAITAKGRETDKQNRITAENAQNAEKTKRQADHGCDETREKGRRIEANEFICRDRIDIVSRGRWRLWKTSAILKSLVAAGSIRHC